MRTTRYAFLATMLVLAPVTKAMASGSDDGSQGNATGTFSFRNERYADPKGQRTGDATRYVMHRLGVRRGVDQDPRIRPEIRYEKSYDVDTHDGGRKDQQMSAVVATRSFITEVDLHDHPAA